MTSEVEERPRLVTAGYGRHGSQWVKSLLQIILLILKQIQQVFLKKNNRLGGRFLTPALDNTIYLPYQRTMPGTQ